MAIYLVRHGETQWTVEARHTGRTDLPLNARGEEQARDLGQRLSGIHFERVLSSPRQRALQTVELALGSLPVEVSQELAEFDYGDYEGLTSDEILTRRPGWRLWSDGCPGGESPEQVLERARRVLEQLRADPGLDYALFGHGHMLRTVAAAYIGADVGLCCHLTLKVASVSILDHEHETPSIAAWDVT